MATSAFGFHVPGHDGMPRSRYRFDFSTMNDTEDDSDYNAALSAELKATGAILRLSVRAAVTHWLALLLLAASVLIALALLFLPPLRGWSDRAVWVLLAGVVAYILMVLSMSAATPERTPVELQKLRQIRRGIADLRDERRLSRGAHDDDLLLDTLSDAVRHLDDHVIPALRQLLARRRALAIQLGRFERGEQHPPDASVLDRLRAIHARQQAAIAECVQQAANAHATLVALLQEGDDETVIRRARTWANDLMRLYDTLEEVLHGDDEGATPEPAAQPETHASQAQPSADVSPTGASEFPPSTDITGESGSGAAETDGVAGDVDRVPVEAASTASPESSGRVDPLIPLVREALRRINDPARLSLCDLANHLPRTIAETSQRDGTDARRDLTPLEKAHALRTVLLESIERLRPTEASNGRTGGELLRHHVICGLYVERLSPHQIITREHISERTVHRYQGEGLRVLAHELGQHEARLDRGPRD